MFSPGDCLDAAANAFLGGTTAIGNAIANSPVAQPFLSVTTDIGTALGGAYYDFASAHPCIALGISAGVQIAGLFIAPEEVGLEEAAGQVPWVVGEFPAGEEAAVTDTLGHIDSGTQPSGALAEKWGSKFKNWAGDLPGARGADSPYREYRVAPPAGEAGAGTARIVVNSETGAVYYSWTHYGDVGPPAFVRIR